MNFSLNVESAFLGRTRVGKEHFLLDMFLIQKHLLLNDWILFFLRDVKGVERMKSREKE